MLREAGAARWDVACALSATVAGDTFKNGRGSGIDLHFGRSCVTRSQRYRSAPSGGTTKPAICPVAAIVIDIRWLH